MTHLPEWAALSGAVYAHEVTIATFEFQKLVESGTSRVRNISRNGCTSDSMWSQAEWHSSIGGRQLAGGHRSRHYRSLALSGRAKLSS